MAGSVLTVMSISQLILSLVIGMVYDVIGRRKPVIFFLLINIAVQFWIPFISNINVFYIAAALLAPLIII